MSSPKKLTDFKVLCFDCYGTLIDWETGIYAGLESIAAGSELKKTEVMQLFDKYEGMIQEKHPEMLYSTVLATAYECLRAHLSGSAPSDIDALPLSPEAQTFGSTTIASWLPFPDTVQALERLSKHYKLLILSNVDLASFKHTQAHLEHGFQFEKILTAQEIGSYKPDLKNFEYMLGCVEEFGAGTIKREEVLVTAGSLRHDHRPANQLGLSSVYICRKGDVIGSGLEDVKYGWKFETLGAMADAVDAEAAR